MTAATAPTSVGAAAGPKPRLSERYQRELVPALMAQFKHTNRLAVPRLTKIVLNIGCGEAAHDAKILEEVQRNLATISGQRPIVTRAKKAVSNFKIQEGDPVGCKVTLRRRRMYEFLDRLVSIALPRIRDFRGLSAKSFDASGNYSFGIRELSMFPELHPDDLHYPMGMDVVIATTAPSPQEARALLEGFKMPFEKAAKTEQS